MYMLPLHCLTFAAPLKGLSERLNSYRSPSLLSSSIGNRASLGSRIRKDGGIKLLDINEQPLGYAQAKKRKRMLELEEQQKKVAEAQAAATTAAAAPPEVNTTPEYAQGLTPINPPATAATTATTVAQTYVTPAAPTTIVTPLTAAPTRTLRSTFESWMDVSLKGSN